MKLRKKNKKNITRIKKNIIPDDIYDIYVYTREYILYITEKNVT